VVEEDERLAALPPGVVNRLLDRLKTLRTPEPYQDAIQVTTRQAIQAWQANPETASNCLVVLGRPVEAIGSIIKDSLDNYLLDCEVRFFLSAYYRPPDPLTITGHLQREIEPEQPSSREKPETPVTQSDIHEQIPKVMIIPSLEQCFLRCIQGWEGIEYFQTLATQDTSRFWIFGCNHWAWAFLEKVCQVSAYLEQTVALPDLTGAELETWLRPLLNSSVKKRDDEQFELAVDAERDIRWDSLASLAGGSAATAAHLWLKSLRVKAEDLTAESSLPADTTHVALCPVKPSLPSLMSLDAMDRYVLHSLLLHGEMTRSHLALSLGEAERTIRSRVQVLRREHIILHKGRRLSVHPAHYPKLYSELENNNFLIGKA
jgi:hypothetical protein